MESKVLTSKKEQLLVSEQLLDRWQHIVNMIARLANVPAGLIMRVVEDEIKVFVSSHTENNPYTLGDKEHLEGSGLYCEHVIKHRKRLLIDNALEDPEWCTNPDIKLNMISYLGVPLELPDGNAFGTLCILDSQANQYNGDILTLMDGIRSLIESHLSLLYMNTELGESNRELAEYIAEIKVLRGIVPICSYCHNIRDKDNSWSPIDMFVSEHTDAQFSHSICPTCFKIHYPGVKSE